MHSSCEAWWSSAPSSGCSRSSAPPKPAIERLSLLIAPGMIRERSLTGGMMMRSALFAALLGTSALIAVSAVAQTSPPPAPADQPATQGQAPAAQPAAPVPAAASAPPAAQAASGPADLCKELLAYAEKKAAEPPKPAPGQAAAPAQPPAPPQPAPAAGGSQQQASAAPPRVDGQSTGTQGGGSQGPSTSTNTTAQPAAPPTAPVATGAAPEAASSPHASGSGSAGGAPAAPAGPWGDTKLAGDTTLQQVRDTTGGGDRQACRDSAQKLRRAGADMPAPLLALAAYEPDPAKRQ